MKEQKVIEVFLGSPGDVPLERERAFQVIERINKDRLLPDGWSFKGIGWDQTHYPKIAWLSPQEAITQGVSLPGQCDIAIFVFWKRIGTPLPPESFTKNGAGDAPTGSLWEFHNALESEHKPWVLVYRAKRNPEMDDLELADPVGFGQQVKAVNDFFAAFQDGDGRYRADYYAYRDIADFARQLEQDLKTYIREKSKTGPAEALREKVTKKSSPQIGNAVTLQTDSEIKRYRQAIESIHEKLSLAGFKTRLRVPIDLEKLYVPLNAVVDLRGVGGVDFADAADADKRLREEGAAQEIPLIESFREAQQRNRRGLVILGEPGSGKTTHLKRLLLWCLRRGPGELGLADDLLPVFLPLWKLEDLSQGLETYIERQLDSPHLHMPKGFGARLLERGRLLLLLDGLDEVSDPGLRSEVARWIEEASAARSDCVPVVTCRFAGYDDKTRLNEQFLELHLRPLTPEQSESFICNWYRAVEVGLAAKPSQGEVEARARSDNLIKTLRKPDFRAARMVEMTRNPLLLANLCLVHRDRGTLPKGRARLYDECIEVLLERWQGSKGLPLEITAEDGRRILQPVALWLHGKKERRASAKELTPVLEQSLKAVRWQGGDARRFLRTVRDQSGLLTGWGGEEYGFMHLGFQEYLAASELRRQAFEGDTALVRQLAVRYGDSWWQEVILILLAQGNPSLFTPFIREVVQQPAFVAETRLMDLILEEAVEISTIPFEELLDREPGHDPELWSRQELALRLIQRLGDPETVAALRQRLRTHPSPAIQSWLSGSEASADREIIHSPRGGVELVRIPGGTFRMGSPPGEQGVHSDEHPQHTVSVPPFYLGRFPVTNEEYGRFLEANPAAKEPSRWGDRQFNQARQPVIGVSWEDARQYAQWAGGRLPSEAEWEYAVRAGTDTRYWFGDDESELAENAWYSGNSGGKTHTVGQKNVNPFGLSDLHGNVWEWVEDCWHGNYEGAPEDGSAWLEANKGDCTQRVIRGGSWNSKPGWLRSACRVRNAAGFRNYFIGFRLAQDL